MLMRPGKPPASAVSDTGVLTLVRPTMPHPDESLVGVIARVTHRNVLGNLRAILEELGLDLPRPGTVGQAISTEQLKWLATKIGCDDADLRGKLHPYVGEDGASALVSWNEQLLRRSHLELSRRRISPATLKTQEHHSAAWLLDLLPYCPISFERLIDRCLDCGEPLGWVAARGIGTCEHCRKVVRHPTGETLPKSLQGGYTSFAELLSICPRVRKARLARLPEALRGLALFELVSLTISLGQSIQAAGQASDPLRADAPSDERTRAECVAMAAPLLDGWPSSLRARLAEIADDPASDQSSTLRLIRRLGHRNSSGPIAAVVREALPELFGRGRHTLKALRTSVMNPLALMIKGGFTSAQYAILRDGEFLGETATTGTVRTSIHFSKAVADDLIEAKRGSEDFSRLAQTLGVPRYAVEQLICLGEVEHIERAAFRALGLQTRISSDSIRELTSTLLSAPGDAPEEAQSLIYLMRRYAGSEKPWGSVIQALRSGTLSFWLLPDETYRNGRAWPLMRRVLVLPEQFGATVFPRFERSKFPGFPFEETLNQQDALEVLCAKHAMLRKAIQAGEIASLRGWGNSQAVSRSGAALLAQKHVSAPEISHWLNLEGNNQAHRAMVEFPRVRRRPLGWLRSDCEEHLPPRSSSAVPHGCGREKLNFSLSSSA